MYIRNFLKYCDGKTYQVTVNDQIENFNSKFQKIEIIDTRDHGRCLIIDDVIQACSSDHSLYDKVILDMLSKDDKKVLILGGGDRLVACTGASLSQSTFFRVIDIDTEVVNVSEKYFECSSFGNQSRIDIVIDDLFNHLDENLFQYDGIVCDLTDTPIGLSDVEFEVFYRKIFTLLSRYCKKEVWVSVQSGTPVVAPGMVDTNQIIKELMEFFFRDVYQKNVLIPSFGEEASFLFAIK